MGFKGTVSQARSQRRIAANLALEAALAGLGDAEPPARLTAWPDQAVPWTDILVEAKRLHLAPLLFLGIHSSPGLLGTVPLPVTGALRSAAHSAAVRVTRLEQACAEAVTAAASAEIPVLVLKGLALGALVYPSAVARPMDDVDLLVAETDRERLAEILHGSGYRNNLRGEEDFYLPSMTYSIDLHTGLVNTTRIPARGALWPMNFDELWARSQTFRVAGIPVRTLGPSDTVTHLGVHAVHHHGLSGGLWIVDLLACLRAWPHALEAIATAPSPVRRSLWYCLEVLAARGRDPVPDVRLAIRPERVFPAEKWILAAISHGDVLEAIRYPLTLACLPHWKARVTFLRQLLFPRAGVYTDGFEAARNSALGRRQHWRMAMRFCRDGLRAALTGRTQV